MCDWLGSVGCITNIDYAYMETGEYASGQTTDAHATDGSVTVVTHLSTGLHFVMLEEVDHVAEVNITETAWCFPFHPSNMLLWTDSASSVIACGL